MFLKNQAKIKMVSMKYLTKMEKSLIIGFVIFSLVIGSIIYFGSKSIIVDLEFKDFPYNAKGVISLTYNLPLSPNLFEDIKTILRDTEHLEEDDLIINIASMPIKSKGMSNMIRLSYV